MKFSVPSEAAGQRLDRFVADASGLSRSQIGVRIAAGDVLVDGRAPGKAGEKLRGGELIELEVPPPPPTDAIPQDIPVDVIYEDEHLVVVNKPADMVVHPSPGHDTGTLVNALLYRFHSLAPSPSTEDGRPRPGIVHRLDKDTSGLLVVARTVQAREGLSAQLADRTLSRVYLAVVHGPKLDDSGTWDTAHGRHPKDRKRFSSRVREGRRAVTHWQVLARSRTTALVQCRLHTGRTHQIRVHFSDHGHPLVGDATYGGVRKSGGAEGAALRKLKRQALHAHELTFIHPANGKTMTLRAPLPEDMATLLTGLFGEIGRSFA